MKFYETTKQTKDKVISIRVEDLANIIAKNLKEVFDDFPTIAIEMFAVGIASEIIRKSEEGKKEEKTTSKPTENKEKDKTMEEKRKKYEDTVANALADLVKTLFED